MQGWRGRYLSLVERPERPKTPNGDKLDPRLGIWEDRVALSLCWLMPTMNVGSWASCVCVCVYLKSPLISVILTHLLNALPLMHVVSVFTCAFLFV